MASCQPKKDEFGHSNLKPEENMAEKIAEVKNEVIKKILLKHQAVFGELPGAGTVKKLVTMDLGLKDEFKAKSLRLHPYRLSQEDSDEVDRQVLEGVVGGVIEEITGGDYPKHCSPCFLVDKSGSFARCLVVDFHETESNNEKSLRDPPIHGNDCGKSCQVPL